MKRFLFILLSLLCMSAADITAQQPTIESLNRQIARAEEEIKRNEALLSKIKGERAITQSQLKLIASRIANRLDIISSLGKQIDICARGIKQKNSEIKEINERIGVLKQEYAEMIYAAYKNALLNNSLTFLFAAEDFHDMTLRVNYMKRYNRMREAKAAELDSLSGVIKIEVEKLNEQKAQLERSKKSRADELVTLRADEKTYRNSSQRLAADEKKIAGRIKQQEREKQNAQKELQRLVAEEARRNASVKRTEAEMQASVKLSSNFAQNMGKFPYPVSGGVITDHFGKHAHPTQRGLIIDNKGVNIAGEKGASVRCIFEGTVSRVVFIKGLNNCVMVNHGSYYTVYSNLENVNVKANDRVGRGQVIGSLPTTGDNDDWYLHFELWKGTTFLNPEKWLAR